MGAGPRDGDPSAPDPDDGPGRIRVTTPTTVVVVAGVGAIIGLITFRVVEVVSGTAPTFPITLPALLGVMAVAVIALARTTWRRVHRDRVWVAAARGVRLLALGKTATVLGAGLGGFLLGCAGLLLDGLAIAVNQQRFAVAGLGALACAVLVPAGLWLQRACRVPEDPDDPVAR